jgi:Pectate lyase superfamily protein
MSTQFSKRALTAGLGVGALALLAQTQDASADTPFTSFAFRATGAPTPRTMPDRLAEVVNVKEFGALGNGSNDDRPAIQAAFDYAFGSAAAPHGTNSVANKQVFFPGGNYLLGAPLVLTQVKGARIVGSGRMTTRLAGRGGAVIVTNGLVNSHIEGFLLDGNGGVCLDLDWDGNGSVGLDGNTFVDMFYGTGSVGVRIGNSGHGGSNNVFLNNFAGGCTTGLATTGDQAINQSYIGGNMQGCTTGILVTRGSVSSVMGTGFQQGSSSWDIQTATTAAAAPISVIGCRSESHQHAYFTNNVVASVSGVSHTENATSVLVQAQGGVVLIEGCNTYGTVAIRDGARVTIQNCFFVPLAWIDAPANLLWYTPTNPIGANIELEDVRYDWNGSKAHIFKERWFTTNGSTLTKQSYTLT